MMDPKGSGSSACTTKPLDKSLLNTVKKMIKADQLQRAMETKNIINEKCIERAQLTMDLYDSGEQYDAAEAGVQALSGCFFFASLVLENFGAGDEGEALTEAASRSFWGLYIDDEFLIPPQDLVLGPK